MGCGFSEDKVAGGSGQGETNEPWHSLSQQGSVGWGVPSIVFLIPWTVPEPSAHICSRKHPESFRKPLKVRLLFGAGRAPAGWVVTDDIIVAHPQAQGQRRICHNA